VWIYKGDIERGKQIDFKQVMAAAGRGERPRGPRPPQRAQTKEVRHGVDA
jgi:hypothetical protein